MKLRAAGGLLSFRRGTELQLQHTWLLGHAPLCQSLSTGRPVQNNFFKGGRRNSGRMTGYRVTFKSTSFELALVTTTCTTQLKF